MQEDLSPIRGDILDLKKDTEDINDRLFEMGAKDTSLTTSFEELETRTNLVNQNLTSVWQNITFTTQAVNNLRNDVSQMSAGGNNNGGGSVGAGGYYHHIPILKYIVTYQERWPVP